MPTDTDTYDRCNGRLRSNGESPDEKAEPGEWAGEGYCQRPAGEGTSHNGEGRCKLHGGADGIGRPVETGLHSELRDDLREYVEQAATMDAPGDLRGELAVLRGLLYDYLNGNDGLERDDVDAAHKLLKEIRRTSDTIHKQLQRERLTKQEEEKLFATFAKIIRQYVPESDRDDALDQLEATASGGGRRALESEF
ncbi:hypothetical protein GGQ05_003561 [Salinibacter ruber]|uniref:hypothetical protein n=1 Tax=Salinibacter ruber TaxID=146919 RepID=UPI00216A8A8D|nr:hypothetical protein [Salinibacter ruber]MCS4172069.1 hypothetical protein [Salinibacter ruber]